jgi:hypothetical protein
MAAQDLGASGCRASRAGIILSPMGRRCATLRARPDGGTAHEAAGAVANAAEGFPLRPSLPANIQEAVPMLPGMKRGWPIGR